MTKPAAAPEPPPAASSRTVEESKRRPLWARLLWGVFLLVNVPLVLAVGVGLAAAYLHPRVFWWAQLAAIFLPFLSLVLLGATLVPIVARRWGWLLLHLTLLILVALRSFPPERFAGHPAPGAGDLVLMSFNVPQAGPSREALGDSMVALMAARRPDVAALQEAWVSAPERNRPAALAVQLEAVADTLPYRLAVPARLSSRTGWSDNATGVPLLVRTGAGAVEVLEQTAVPLGEQRDQDASMAIRTHFRWREREAVLYNLHLRSFGERKPWNDNVRLSRPGTWLPYLRQYQSVYRMRAAEVEQLLEVMGEETLPLIVAGDFNGTANNWSYRRLRAGRTDAFRAAGEGSGHTYRADKPLVRIDFVLADPAWVVTAAEVPFVGFSDHRPVVVRLRWREEGAAQE